MCSMQTLPFHFVMSLDHPGAMPGAFSDSAVEAITAMGFSRKEAERALWMTHGNPERAAAWLMDQAA